MRDLVLLQLEPLERRQLADGVGQVGEYVRVEVELPQGAQRAERRGQLGERIVGERQLRQREHLRDGA